MLTCRTLIALRNSQTPMCDPTFASMLKIMGHVLTNIIKLAIGENPLPSPTVQSRLNLRPWHLLVRNSFTCMSHVFSVLATFACHMNGFNGRVRFMQWRGLYGQALLLQQDGWDGLWRNSICLRSRRNYLYFHLSIGSRATRLKVFQMRRKSLVLFCNYMNLFKLITD